MHITTQGIVLRETTYKESDKILTVLTADGGKCTIKARGCRRKGSALAAPSQLLVWSDMVLFSYRDQFTLKEAATLEEFRGLRTNLEKLALGSYFAEVTASIAQEELAQPELLALLLNCLYALDKLEKPLTQVKTAFEARLLCLAGYEPMVGACIQCGASDPVDPRLDLSHGVIHCAQCRMTDKKSISMPLTPAALSALRYMIMSSSKQFLSFQLAEDSLTCLNNLTEAYLMTQLERGFRTLDFYKQLTF